MRTSQLISGQQITSPGNFFARSNLLYIQINCRILLNINLHATCAHELFLKNNPAACSTWPVRETHLSTLSLTSERPEVCPRSPWALSWRDRGEEEEQSKFPREGKVLYRRETPPDFPVFVEAEYRVLSTWSETSNQELRNHDGSPFCEGDLSHLRPVPVLLCSCRKERYVRELSNMYVAEVVQTPGGFSLSHSARPAFPEMWQKSRQELEIEKRKRRRGKKATEKLDPAWEQSFSLASWSDTVGC